MTTESPRLNFKRSNLKAMEMESIQYPDWKGDDTWQVDHWPENFPISRLQGISGASGALWLALRKKKAHFILKCRAWLPILESQTMNPAMCGLATIYSHTLKIKKKVQQRKTRFITIPPNILGTKNFLKNRHTPQKRVPWKKRGSKSTFLLKWLLFGEHIIGFQGVHVTRFNLPQNRCQEAGYLAAVVRCPSHYQDLPSLEKLPSDR